MLERRNTGRTRQRRTARWSPRGLNRRFSDLLAATHLDPLMPHGAVFGAAELGSSAEPSVEEPDRFSAL